MNQSIVGLDWTVRKSLKCIWSLLTHCSTMPSHYLILSWSLLYCIKHKGFVRREFCSSSLHSEPTIANSVSTQPTVSLQAPLELPGCNLKLASIIGRPGLTEERGRLSRVSRWQVSWARVFTYKTCLWWLQDEISAPSTTSWKFIRP